MPGRWGKLLIGVLSVAVAAPASAMAAQEAVVATKSRAVSSAPSDLVASAAKKKKKKKKKKKRKKGTPAVTQSSPVAFASGTTVTSTAACTGKTHISGGGFAVSPSFSPPGTGLRSVTVTSQPTGPSGWNASGSAFSTPAAAGSFTTYARCENNTLGELGVILSSSVALPPANAQTFTFNCPPGTHALSGGYAGTGIGGFNYAANNFRIILLQSRRSGPGQWTIQVANSSFSPVAASATGSVICEQDARGRTINEVSTFAPLINDARATGDPTCAGKTHVVSGGFQLSPNGVGAIPSTAIDEFQPVGKSTWHVGLHEIVGFALPAGSSLQSYAYCAPDTVAKKKKRRKKKKKK